MESRIARFSFTKAGLAKAGIALIILLCLLALRSVTAQGAGRQREMGNLQQTIAAQRAKMDAQESELNAKSRQLDAESLQVAQLASTIDGQRNDLKEKANQIAQLASTIDGQQSTISEQKDAINGMQAQIPSNNMSSEQELSTYVQDIINEGLQKFGSDIVCQVLKNIWNSLFPSLQIN